MADMLKISTPAVFMMTPSKRFSRAFICAYLSAHTCSWAENCDSRFIFGFRYLRFGLLFDFYNQGPHAAGRWQLPKRLQDEVDFVYVEVEGHAVVQGVPVAVTGFFCSSICWASAASVASLSTPDA